ncbi:MAG: GMP synthase [Bacteroidia bacterium]|nr:GMP synthase [Bacteroidota bacterium]MBP6412545.1 GMP synthase [Bacteroidia bacterium]
MSESSLKVAILDLYDNHPNQGMRCIKEIVEEFKLSYNVYDVRAKNEVPAMDYDIFISSGGPGNPLPIHHEWEKKYFELIDALHANNLKPGTKKKYVFFICHSFQMVMHHFRLAQLTKRKSPSFGVLPVHKTHEGLSEPILQNLKEPFYIVDSRDYQIVQPNRDRMHKMGAKILCIEKERHHVPLERAIMCVRFDEYFIGTQFHPEADVKGMMAHYKNPDKIKQTIEAYGDAKYHTMIDGLNDEEKIKKTNSEILPNFLKQSIKALTSNN